MISRHKLQQSSKVFQSFSHCCNEGCWGKVWLGARAIVSISKKWKLLASFRKTTSASSLIPCTATFFAMLKAESLMILLFGKGFHDLTWFMVVKGTRKSVMVFHATFGVNQTFRIVSVWPQSAKAIALCLPQGWVRPCAVAAKAESQASTSVRFWSLDGLLEETTNEAEDWPQFRYYDMVFDLLNMHFCGEGHSESYVKTRWFGSENELLDCSWWFTCFE